MSEGIETTAGAEATVDVATTATEAKTETPVTETAKEETAAAEVKTTESSAAEDDEQSNRAKRESGYSRMKRRALLAETALANQRLRENAGTTSKDTTEQAPREEDFNGDWGKFIAASAAFEAKQAVKSVLSDDRKASQTDRAQQLHDEVLADFEERKDVFKAKATDFDTVVEGFVNGGGKFSDVVRELVIDSDVGPELTYHLAKHPALASKLNSLPPLQAAKEVARIEDTLSKPSTKATKVQTPVKPLNGGAGPAADVSALAKNDDATDLISHWRNQAKARA